MRRAAMGLAAGACMALSAPLVRAEVRRDALDAREVEGMRAVHPHAAELLEQGEAAAQTGALAEAEALFARALAEHREGSLLERRQCQVLTALGQRAEATRACTHALEGARSNANLRASVRALVGGPTAPTMADASMALELAARARDLAPGQLTPAAAFCDIAASLGDGIMLRHCADELHRIDPDAADTRRAEALFDTGRSSLVAWASRGALGALLLSTLVDALRRRARRARTTMRGAVGVGVLAAATFAAMPASADVPGQEPGMLSKWKIDDEHPESHLPSEKDRNADPMEFGYWLQDVILRAEVYSRHGRHDVAVKLYSALAMAVPERAVAFTKMCDEYEAMGDLVKATASCETALLRDGLMVKDYEHYVRLVLAHPGALTERQTTALHQVLAHMRDDGRAEGHEAADALACDVAVRTSDEGELTSCVDRMTLAAPRGLDTVSYRWALAMLRGDHTLAATLVDDARTAGLAADRVAEMERAMTDHAHQRRARQLGIAAASALFVVLAALLAVRASRRRRDPEPA